MDSLETLIPDNKGNHLVVVLSFYDNNDKTDTFHIPEDLLALDIADIAINKIDLDKPLNIAAFHRMCQWLIDQFLLFPNAVFSFICSTDPLDTNHFDISPELYRWRLFDYFYRRNIERLDELAIITRDIIVGPEGYQTFARVFYRRSHAPIIHLVTDHLQSKYQ